MDPGNDFTLQNKKVRYIYNVIHGKPYREDCSGPQGKIFVLLLEIVVYFFNNNHPCLTLLPSLFFKQQRHVIQVSE